MTTDSEFVDEPLLEEYATKLSTLYYDGVGVVAALVISPQIDVHNYLSAMRVVPGEGVDGQYPGKQWWKGKLMTGRQVSAINAEVLDALEIPFDVSGDNLIIRGIDLSSFAPGDTLRIGDALLTVTPTAHLPCSKLARRTSMTKKKALEAGRLRGIFLDAREPAVVYLGDAVERLVISEV